MIFFNLINEIIYKKIDKKTGCDDRSVNRHEYWLQLIISLNLTLITKKQYKYRANNLTSKILSIFSLFL